MPTRPRPRAPTRPPLRTALSQRLSDAGRVAVVGVGSDLRGDDALGALVARRLMAASGASPGSRWQAFDGGTAPENFTGEIARFLAGAGRPHLLLVDAADLKLAPGASRLLPIEEIGGISCSTHSLPLPVLAGYLVARCGCTVSVLAVQPRCIDFGAPVSPEVRRAVRTVAAAIRGAVG